MSWEMSCDGYRGNVVQTCARGVRQVRVSIASSHEFSNDLSRVVGAKLDRATGPHAATRLTRPACGHARCAAARRTAPDRLFSIEKKRALAEALRSRSSVWAPSLSLTNLFIAQKAHHDPTASTRVRLASLST